MRTPGEGSDAAAPAGLEIGGGGSIRVDTAEMLRAAGLLEGAREDLASAAARAAAIEPTAAPARAAALRRARDLLGTALQQAGRAAEGLRTAAMRYGWAEHTAADLMRVGAAFAGAVQGGVVRLALGPSALPAAVLLESGPWIGFLAVRVAWEEMTTGHVAPQLDPVVLRALALSLSSLDDQVRGFLFIEGPKELLTEDPGALFGTESISALAAALLLHPAGAPMTVTPGPSRPVPRPRDLVELADRLPDGKEPEGQVRVERYDGPDGTRWIVYIAGTVTFDRESGDEPFDLASNLLGVGDRPSDSQQAVLEAMRQAGVGADEPVLFVGHSQGALNAVRLAEDSGYRAGGVVQFGGPTAQIALPDTVPVLSVEHDEDLVPVLGGVAAAGAPGLNRVVVRRSLPDGGRGPGLDKAFPSHEMRNYRETLQQAQDSGSPQVARFRGEVAGFLDGGDGSAVRYRARRDVEPAKSVTRVRGISAPAPPARTADAGSPPPRSR